MASAQKISELTTAGPLTGAELVPIVQNGGTLQTTVSAFVVLANVSLLPVVSALQTQITQVSAATSVNAAAITSTNAVVGNLTNNVNALSIQTNANTNAITSVNAVADALEVRVSAVSAGLVSANAVTSALDTRVANVSASVSTLNIQMAEVQASISAINSVLAAIDVSAILAVEARVSALEIRVSAVSVLVSANTAAITSVNNVVSALEIRVSNASAAIVSTNAALANVSALVSALDIRVAAVSASVSALQIQVNNVSAALTSTNNVVSALEIRVSAVSALASANAAAITSTNNVVSALEVRVSTVSAAVSVHTAAITSINAVVSLKANRNGDFLTNVQYIDFNTTTSYAPTPGRLTWDIESGTLDLGLTGTVNLLIGQRTVAQVYNNSGVTLPRGKAVRVTGAQGQRLTGALALADSDANSLTIFGIMLETVSVNRSGYVATDGLIRNFNTSGFADGDIIYLSPVSAGELTPVKPVSPQHLVQMGYIVNGGSVGAGEIYVKVQNGYELGELHDVKTSASTSLADGEVLAYNVSAKVWTNSTALIEAQASISALNIQLAAVSALASVNAAAITSTNNVVSALEIRVSAASATGTLNTASIVSINAVLTSILAILTNTNFRITES